jgi:5'/3'-nucleotidase SurE
MRILLTVLFVLACPVSAEAMRILLTNDDGYLAPGIVALDHALRTAGHTVYRVAPEVNQSGTSASISIRGIEVSAHEDNVWSVAGTPADAVRFALGELLKEMPPDIVVSGANFGNNTGRDVAVSGTVGAALTARQLGYAAIAISVEVKYTERAEGFPSTRNAFAAAGGLIVDLLSELGQPEPGLILNINFPARRIPLGVRAANLADHSLLTGAYTQQPDGSWTPDYDLTPAVGAGIDAALLAQGYITLTWLPGHIEQGMGTLPSDLARRLNAHLPAANP